MGNVIAISERSKAAITVKSDRSTRRKYLTGDEIKALIQGAGRSRSPRRDQTLIRVMYHHGLRCAEACALRWEQIDFKGGTLHVHRVKGGIDSLHPLSGPEIRALRQLQGNSPYVFISRRGGPLAPRTVFHIVAQAAVAAGLPGVHPHQLRHSCGFYLANKGHDTRAIQVYLGHANIRHTTTYTELTPDRFRRFWPD